MAGNVFGQLFRVTTFGESHGEMIGFVIDGCPAGLTIDVARIQADLDRRRPGQSRLTTARRESDTVRIVSGVFEGQSTGAPLAAFIPNEDARSRDYAPLAELYRPSHADYTYEQKYGLRDHRGGGRSSARETAARVGAGAIAKLLLAAHGARVDAYVSQVGPVTLDPALAVDPARAEDSLVRCPDPDTAQRMIEVIDAARADGDTVGGVISGIVRGLPAGLGEPVFDRLHADLGKAMLSINAAKGFEIGSGFAGAAWRGSAHNDVFEPDGQGGVRTRTNHSGGVQGGISNGMDVVFRVAFKPVATLLAPQDTVDREGRPTTVEVRGRHDPCVVPRAVPIVEAMAALTLADHLLRARASRVEWPSPPGRGYNSP